MLLNVFLELDTEYRYWSFMEAHSAHSSLPAKAKMEAMDALTSAWTGIDFIYRLAPLCSSFHFFIHRASPSLPSCCSCPFHSGRKPRIDDDYSILWRYLPDISFLQHMYLHMRRQMIMMTIEPKLALFLGFSSELVSQFYL